MSKTLADMAAEERFDCVGMWCDVKGFTRPTPIVEMWGKEVELLVYNNLRGHITATYEFAEVTPRFDLPRWATPEGEPLPGEWHDDDGMNSLRRFVADWEPKPDPETEPRRVNGMVNMYV